MRAPIAKIRINAGNPGWYDSLTNIHLTITRPEALVYEGSNTTNIKKAVSFGLVHVTEGSLDEESVKTVETKSVKEEVVREVAPQVEVKTEEVVTETVEEVKETIVEESTEEIEQTEEVVEEKPKAKKTTKKKSTKKDVE